MKNAVRFGLIAFTLLFLSACKDDDKPSTPSLIDPDDANSLSASLSMPAGSSSRTGAPPASSGGSSGAATVLALTSSTTTSNGSSTPVVFNYENGSNSLAGVYVQVSGANSYYDVPLSGPTAGQVTIPVGLPTNVDEGSFILEYCVYDVNDLVSNVGSLNVNVLKLGTGSLQISLSWNTATDQDLYVTDPSGTEISYSNSFSETGGELDYDNTSGYGPENIFWQTDAPDGSYSVAVNDFTGSGESTICYVTISAPGRSKTYTVTTQNGSTASVVSFTKSGSSYSF